MSIRYPTTDARAGEARIDVRDPVFGRHAAQVNLRPVHLGTLESLALAGDAAEARRRQQHQYGGWLAHDGSRASAQLRLELLINRSNRPSPAGGAPPSLSART